MGGWRRASVLAIALGAVALSGSRNAPIVVEQRPSQGVYSRNSKEAFLTTDQLDYIRPGYHITVNSITIPADLQAARRRELHRRPQPAARSQWPGHAGHSLGEHGPRLVRPGLAQLHLLYDAHADLRASEHDSRRHGHSGRSRLRRQMDRSRGGPLDLQVQDGPSRRLRPDEDDDARDLRHARARPTFSGRITTRTSSTTFAPMLRPSPTSGTS